MGYAGNSATSKALGVLAIYSCSGWFITPGIFIEFTKMFGKFSLGHHTMAALLAPFYFPWLAAQKDTKFIGRKQRVSIKKQDGESGWMPPFLLL
jgi:hypothetical protein